jgi:hypothetical protein
MGLKSLWQRWFKRPATARRTRPAPPRTWLAVEELEDRMVPASFMASAVAELIADVNAANLSAEADTITLAPGKTFSLMAVNHTDHYYGATGLPVIAAGGGSLTIIGNGDVIERSKAKGTPAFRLLSVAVGASLTLQDLTLQGGYASGVGGGILSQGTLTLTGVTVQNNTARGGAYAAGGGISSSGTLTVQDSTIRNNLAVGGVADVLGDGGDAFGGGVVVSGGTATFFGTAITGNEARAGKGTGTYRECDPFDGCGVYHAQDGHAYGGGLSIGNALVYLDAFTVSHVKSNRASTDDPNTAGAYTLLP